MSLQPSASTKIDRSTTTPFLLRLYWRQYRPLEPWEFSVAPPPDTSNVLDYSSLLPASIRQQSVQIYTWPTCTLAELTGLLTSVLPSGVLPTPAVGTRLVFKLVFPDTRGGVSDSGRGKWIDKPLGAVVIGGRGRDRNDAEADEEMHGANGDEPQLEGDASKTLADARFVIGDYIACTIYPPTTDGRGPPVPSARGAREPYMASRGPAPLSRENGYGSYGPPRGGRGRGGGGGGFGAAPPMGDWRRGERPGGYAGERPGGYGGGGGGGGYRGRGGGRPY